MEQVAVLPEQIKEILTLGTVVSFIYPPGQLRFNDRHKRLPRNSVLEKRRLSHTNCNVVGYFVWRLMAQFCPNSRTTSNYYSMFVGTRGCLHMRRKV